jgi:hypothetical protein
MELHHPFIRRCIDPRGLLIDCVKLNTFIGRVEKQSEEYSKGDTDLQNNYKGWALELFSEFLIRLMGHDKRIGVTDYQLVDESDDSGVDGHGNGVNGLPCTIQVKYRPAHWILSANQDHLSNFTAASMMKYGVSTDPNDKNMLIITTAKDLHWHTDEQMFHKRVRVLNREKLRVLVDNNNAFWIDFLKSWMETLNKATKPRK